VSNFSDSKIFVIGESRTGTILVHNLLRRLNIASIHTFITESNASIPLHLDPDANRAKTLDFIERSGYRAFIEHPARVFWQSIVEAYPHAHFILTRRSSSEAWLSSMKAFFSHSNAAVNMDALLNSYNSTNDAILDYFSHAPHEFLDVCIDEGWEIESRKIGKFLKVDTTFALRGTQSYVDFEPERLSRREIIINNEDPRIMASDFFQKRAISADSLRNLMMQYGIKKIALSLIPGRCGSTYLAEVARACGFGIGEEIFNERPEREWENLYPTRNFNHFIAHAFQFYSQNGVFYFQITPHRFRDLATLLPLKTLSDLHPPVTVILRRNIFAQALSYYNAEATGLWHSIGDTSSKSVVPFDTLPILHWAKALLIVEDECVALALQLAGEEAGIFYYEDIVSSSAETLACFLQFNSATVTPESLEEALSTLNVRKIVRPGYCRQYLGLLSYFPQIQEMVRERYLHGRYHSNTAKLAEIVDTAIEECNAFGN
jgi:LPS sulfotransferase NodH